MKKLVALVVGVLMVFAFAAAAFAADVYVGTNMYFRFDNDANDDGVADDISDANKIDFFKIDISVKKDFGENANAYLTLETQTYATIPDHSVDLNGDGDTTDPGETHSHPADLKVWRIQNYGYTYKFSDALSAGIMYDLSGVTLSEGQLASNWDWLHVSAFEGKHVLKATGQPVEGLTAGLYFEPVESKYIVKGEYKAEGLKVGGGYSNATPADKNYNIYAEFAPVEGANVYVDYLADGTFILDASWTLDPITLAILYSNEDKKQYGYTVFAADSADISATYALSEDSSVVGGVVYDTAGSELADVYFEYHLGKGYVGVDQYLPDSETVVYGGYKLDGSNTLKGSYNLKTNVWKVVLAVGLW